MTQIAVELSDDLIASIDELVLSGAFPSRSAVVRSGIDIEEVVRSQRRQTHDERYRDGYRRQPETPEELAEAAGLAVRSIHDEPWEPWW